VIEVDRLDGDFAVAYASREPARVDDATRAHLSIFAPDDDDEVLSRAWIRTDRDGSDFFRGEAYLDPGWEQVPVDIGRAYLQTGPVGSLVAWDPGTGDDGPHVFIHALDLDPDALSRWLVDLVDLAGSLPTAAWTVEAPPDRYRLIYSGPERDAYGDSAFLGWQATAETGDEIMLTLTEVGESDLERQLAGLLRSNVSFVELVGLDRVRGHDAIRVTGEGGQVIYLWMETPDVVARLVVQGGGVDPGRVIAALEVADSGTWDALFQTAVEQGGTTATTITPSGG